MREPNEFMQKAGIPDYHSIVFGSCEYLFNFYPLVFLILTKWSVNTIGFSLRFHTFEQPLRSRAHVSFKSQRESLSPLFIDLTIVSFVDISISRETTVLKWRNTQEGYFCTCFCGALYTGLRWRDEKNKISWQGSSTQFILAARGRFEKNDGNSIFPIYDHPNFQQPNHRIVLIE